MSGVLKLTTAYLGLMALLTLSAASAAWDLGALNPVLNLGIAAAKAALVLVFFMHLLAHGTLPRLTVLATCLWLAILFVLTLIDY